MLLSAGRRLSWVRGLSQLSPRQHYNIQHLWPSFPGGSPVVAGGPGTSSWGLRRPGKAPKPLPWSHQVHDGKACPRSTLLQMENFHRNRLNNRMEQSRAPGHSSAHKGECRDGCSDDATLFVHCSPPAPPQGLGNPPNCVQVRNVT